MTARQRKGAGSIRPQPNGRWEARYIDPLTQRRRGRSFDTSEQATAFLAGQTVARHTGDVVVASTVKLADYLCGPDGWLDLYGPAMRQRTREAYKSNATRYINPILGAVPLGKLTERHVRKLQNELRERGLAPNTILGAHATLSVALSAAVSDRMLTRNVAKNVARPTTPKRTVRGKKLVPPTLAELGAVIDALAGTRTQLPFRVTVATGLRIGELQGLKWDDLRPLADGGWALVVDGKWDDRMREYDDQTKTEAGDRLVRITRSLADDLAAHRPDGAPDDAFIFPGYQRTSGPVSSGALGTALHGAQDRAGVRRFRWHDVRHAYPTVLRARGDDWLAISRSMGHSKIAVTTGMYGHVDLTTVAPIDDPREARDGGAR